MKSEKGALVVEAAISLTTFIFALLILYCLYFPCFAQARITVALQSSTRELSSYSYFYNMTGIPKKRAELANQGKAGENTIATNMNDATSNADKNVIVRFFDVFQSLVATGKDVSQNTSAFKDYLLSEAADFAAGEVASGGIKLLMKKYLGDDADAMLKRIGVVGGFSGLNINCSYLDPQQGGSQIVSTCNFTVRVLRLLNIDYTYDFEVCARTQAWLG